MAISQPFFSAVFTSSEVGELRPRFVGMRCKMYGLKAAPPFSL